MAVTFDEWMSDADAVMWHIERDPVLRSTIVSVWLLDRLPDPTRLEQSLSRALAAIPRLRQRVVADPFGVSTPRWEDDPLFDRDYHVRRVAAPGRGTLRDLLDMAAPLAGQAFDKDRPLWELHLVEGLEGGRAGVILRLHHAMSDGVGMVRMTTSLIERSREPRPGADHAETLAEAPVAGVRSSEMEQMASALQHRIRTGADRGRRAAEALSRGLLDLARDPLGSARRIADAAGSVGRLVKPVSEPMSPLWRERSLSLHLDTLLVPFEVMRAAARKVGGTLNDAFVAGVAGGLARYHAALGHTPEALRMSMPINVRSGEDGKRAGNQFVPARMAVPLQIADPAERMRAVAALVRAQRAEPALPLVEEVTGAINRLGVLGATVFVGSMMKAVDFVTSNVPGPPFPVYLAGAKIEQMYPFGPLAGAAVNITLFSYDGELQIGINCDRAAVRDPKLLVRSLEEGIAEVIALA